jgi:hypothetical protein
MNKYLYTSIHIMMPALLFTLSKSSLPCIKTRNAYSILQLGLERIHSSTMVVYLADKCLVEQWRGAQHSSSCGEERKRLRERGGLPPLSLNLAEAWRHSICMGHFLRDFVSYNAATVCEVSGCRAVIERAYIRVLRILFQGLFNLVLFDIHLMCF